MPRQKATFLHGVFWRLTPRQKATFLLPLFPLCEKAATNARAREKPKRVSGLRTGRLGCSVFCAV
jgi:hypothetical protein